MVIGRARKLLHFNVVCGQLDLLSSKLEINFKTLQKINISKVYSSHFCIFSDFLVGVNEFY